MKRWEKLLAWGLFALVCGAVCLAVVLYNHVHQTVPDCYAQWATAELIIAYRKDRGTMPADWLHLQPYFKDAARHHGGQSFEQIQQRIHVDFSSLPQLELDHGEGRMPEVITCASGIGAHWSGAEPNELVNEEMIK